MIKPCASRNALVDCVVIGLGGETRPQGTTPPPPTPGPTSPPSTTSCGMRAGQKIVNGVTTPIEDYPWQVVLSLGNSLNFQIFC